MANDVEDIHRRCPAAIQDEIGVAIGDLGIADAIALQATFLNQLTGLEGLGVAEDAATAGQVVGLAGLALVEVLGGEGHDLARVRAGLELEGGIQNDVLAALEDRGAVAVVELVNGPNFEPRWPEESHRHQGVGHAAAMGTGVHDDRASHGSWNTHGPFHALDAPTGGFPGEARQGFTGAGGHLAGFEVKFELAHALAVEHEARQSCIADQQVGARSQDHHRERSLFGPVDAVGDILDRAGCGKPFGQAAHLEGGHTGQGDIGLDQSCARRGRGVSDGGLARKLKHRFREHKRFAVVPGAASQFGTGRVGPGFGRWTGLRAIGSGG
jgi:hypothetical protein